MPIMSSTAEKLYLSFVVASLVEELFKFIVVYALVFGNSNYNERYDGIVYSVFVSLGFALVENILFVTNPELGGIVTGVMRGVVSVPAHALYGLYMGYYMSMAKYVNKKYVVLSFGIPYILHGVFDTILSFDFFLNFGIIVMYMIILCVDSNKKIKYYISLSPFKNT